MGYYPQESLYKPYMYHGYTVRGTPNCPLIQPEMIKLSIHRVKKYEFKKPFVMAIVNLPPPYRTPLRNKGRFI